MFWFSLKGGLGHGLFLGKNMPLLVPEASTPYSMQWWDFGLVKADPDATESSPWVIYIQASTPDLDFENERVLQQALKNAADYFLENGKITLEHLDQNKRYDASIIIGEPMSVKFGADGTTMVQARLYPYQPQAQNVYNILRSGGKMKASIGGACSKRPGPNGTSEIDRIYWNHLAITSFPVNDHTLVSLQPFGSFVKALGTASAAPLVREDLEGNLLRGTPDLAQKWQALTELLMQRHPGLSEDKAKAAALLLLVRRGETRPAYTAAHWAPTASGA